MLSNIDYPKVFNDNIMAWLKEKVDGNYAGMSASIGYDPETNMT